MGNQPVATTGWCALLCNADISAPPWRFRERKPTEKPASLFNRRERRGGTRSPLRVLRKGEADGPSSAVPHLKPAPNGAMFLFSPIILQTECNLQNLPYFRVLIRLPQALPGAWSILLHPGGFGLAHAKRLPFWPARNLPFPNDGGRSRPVEEIQPSRAC